MYFTYFYRLGYLCATTYQIWWRFDEVLTETSWVIFLAHLVHVSVHRRSFGRQFVIIIVEFTRTHSFPRKILPNFAVQFAKFCGLLRQSCPNFVAHHGLPFVSKLSSVLFKSLVSEGPAGMVTLC